MRGIYVVRCLLSPFFPIDVVPLRSLPCCIYRCILSAIDPSNAELSRPAVMSFLEKLASSRPSSFFSALVDSQHPCKYHRVGWCGERSINLLISVRGRLTCRDLNSPYIHHRDRFRAFAPVESQGPPFNSAEHFDMGARWSRQQFIVIKSIVLGAGVGLVETVGYTSGEGLWRDMRIRQSIFRIIRRHEKHA